MAEVKVWATGDGVRVNPETGRYWEDRTDILPDYPTGDYQRTNLVWDGDSGKIALRAARNEFVSFQVVAEAEEGMKDIRVALDHLVTPGGAKLDGRNIALFKAWYVRVYQPSSGYEKSSLGNGWYPDALIPVPTGEPLVFDLPDGRNAIGESQRNQTVWVDIYLPREREVVPPGVYRGVLTVTWPGGKREIAVELTVWDFALPDELHCRGDIYNNSLARMAPEMELQYYQICRQHRFEPGVYKYTPGLTVDGTEVTIDWRAYDARLRRYLDGSAFTEANGYWGPGLGLPLDHILLPFDCEKGGNRNRAWPMAQPEAGRTPEFEAVWVETARQFREHFETDAHWQRVRKVAFLDGLDESYYDEAYERMVYYCQLLRRGLGKDWFQYRIDGGYSRDAMDRLHPFIDLLVCHTIAFDADKIAHFQEKGVEAWCYGPMVYEQEANSACGSNTFLDLDLFTVRGLAWASWKHRCGYCEWEFEWEGEKSWTDPLNWRTKWVEYNASGLLIYRGSFLGLGQPVPSIRLKSQRRGFQDYEYFWLLREAGREKEADDLVNGVVHTMPFGRASVGNRNIWRDDPEAWDRAQRAAGEMLNNLARANPA